MNNKQKAINHTLNVNINNNENASLVSFKRIFNLNL